MFERVRRLFASAPAYPPSVAALPPSTPPGITDIEAAQAAFDRTDALVVNLMTGLGVPGIDKSRSTRIAYEPEPTPYELNELYRSGGLMAAIVDIPAEEKTKEGFTVEDVGSLDVTGLESAMDDFGVLEHVADLDRWGPYFGGALMMAAVDDGLPPHEPLDYRRVKKLHGFHVLDRHCVEPVLLDGRPPEAYRFNTLCGADDIGVGDVVHASRVIKFVGSPHPPNCRRDYDWWGIPTPHRVLREYKRLLASEQSAEAIMQDLEVDVYHLVGLLDAQTKSGVGDGAGKVMAALQTRLRRIQLMKSTVRGVALDAGIPNQRPAEDLMQKSRNVSGVAELVSLFYRALVAVSRIPATKLLGETKGGMNTGSNSGDLQSFYSRLGAEQRRRLTRWVNWMLTLIMADPHGPTRGQVPDTWTIKWRPMWVPTQLEQAQARKARAEADVLYWKAGAASSLDIRESRLVRGSEGELEAVGDFKPGDDGGDDDAGLDDLDPDAA